MTSTMNRDTVTGIVGAVLLVAAMVGVFLYERANGAGAYDVTWGDGTGEGGSASGNVAVGATGEGTIAVTQVNLQSITFTLAWDSQGVQDSGTWRVTPPAGAGDAQTSEELGGTLTFDDLNAAPTVGTATGATEEDARADLDEGAGTVGVGDWTVSVTYAGGGAPLVPLTGNWGVSSALTWHEPTLSG